jgi:signal transduction histidine kinase
MKKTAFWLILILQISVLPLFGEDAKLAFSDLKPHQKLKSYLQLARELRYAEPTNARQAAQNARKLAVALHDSLSWAEAETILSYISFHEGDYSQAFQQIDEAEAVYFKKKDPAVRGKILYQKARIQEALLNLEDALDNYYHALALFKESREKSGMADVYTSLSQVMLTKGFAPKAYKHLSEAKALRSSKIDLPGFCFTYGAFGDYYLHQNNIHLSLDFYHQAELAAKEANNPYWEGMALQKKARWYLYQNNTQEAKALSMKALRIFEQLNLHHSSAEAAVVVATAFHHEQQFAESNNWFADALSWSAKTDDKYQYIRFQNLAAENLIYAGKLKLAISLINKSIDMSKWYKFTPLVRDGYELLTEAYKKAHDNDNFLNYYRLFISMRDSVGKASDENSVRLLDLQELNENLRTQQELEKLKNQEFKRSSELEKERMRVQYLSLAIFLILAVLLLVAYLVREKNRAAKKLEAQNTIISLKNQQLNESLKEVKKLNDILSISEDNLRVSNETKDRFFSIISHDLRGPLATLSSFLSLLITASDRLSPQELAALASEVEKSMKNVTQLLNNLLKWSQTQSGQIQINQAPVKLESLIRSNVNLVNDTARSKRISVHFRTDEELYLFADENMVDFVLRNLLNNAVKFTPSDGEIFIDAIHNENEAIIKISDTGIGMDEDTLENLFNLVTRKSRNGTYGETGTGLGLILCKEFVTKHEGKIWAENRKPNGTTFSFTLPLYRHEDVAQVA